MASPSFNQIILIGRLAKNPENVHTTNNTPMARYTLAVNRRGNNNEADFILCNVFGSLVASTMQYLHKGSLVMVKGSLRIETYEKDGKRTTIACVSIQEQQFLSGASSQTNNANQYGNNNTSYNNYPQNNQYNNNTAYGNQYNGASQRNNNPTPAQNSEPQQPTYGNQPYQQDDNQPIDENFLNDFTGYNFY